ncbi:hypothetical protein WICPIJ_002815 [Wickerhamomyces pijperi]|uniref:Uncharacterized protein n=1 Tax=Wickerhamomyces pijperi TaxID=599730 RepID=A0A9P8QB10_WICPI|nr:hypothetical protein WICPIJ_002815 [Wickerhamomyces pijperi]
MNSSLSQSVHTSFSTDTLDVRTRATIHLLSDLSEVYASSQVHSSGMDLQDLCSGRHGRSREFNFSIYSARSQQGWVQDVQSVCGHDDLDILGVLEPVQLIKKLQHGSLHFGITTTTGSASGGPNRIDLIHEDDRGSMFPGHDEQLSHHSGPFTNVLLDQFGT